MESAFGGFWDSVMDRFSDLALFLGLVYLYSSVAPHRLRRHHGDGDDLHGADELCPGPRRVGRGAVQGRLHGAARAHRALHDRRLHQPDGRRCSGSSSCCRSSPSPTASSTPGASSSGPRRRSGCRYEPAERRRAPAPQGDRRRRHEPAAAAARDLAHALLDLRAGDLAVRPDGHRHPRLRVADAAGLDRRPARARASGRSAGWRPGCAADGRAKTRSTGPRQWWRAHSRSSRHSSSSSVRASSLANLRLAFQLLRFLRLRSSALLTWSGRQPTHPRLLVAIGHRARHRHRREDPQAAPPRTSSARR